MVRLRTIKKCVEEIKIMDKGSVVSEWVVRKLCKDKCIRYIPSGTKFLVDLDSLLNYLENYDERLDYEK